MPTSTSGDNRQLLDQLVQLTDAVKRLAERQEPRGETVFIEPITEADRIRQRVAFGYQALGALLGRVSRTGGDEFDVPVVAARRRPGIIELAGLPHGAEFVELRTRDKVESLPIFRYDDHDGAEPTAGPATGDVATSAEAGTDSADRGGEADSRSAGNGSPDWDADTHRHPSGRGAVRPERFADTEPIGSLVVLRHRRGPLIAFGPRLAAVAIDRRAR
jgi:hypothetical protein